MTKERRATDNGIVTDEEFRERAAFVRAFLEAGQFRGVSREIAADLRATLDEAEQYAARFAEDTSPGAPYWREQCELILRLAARVVPPSTSRPA